MPTQERSAHLCRDSGPVGRVHFYRDVRVLTRLLENQDPSTETLLRKLTQLAAFGLNAVDPPLLNRLKSEIEATRQP